jgi:glycosyltransferase involved in cell wall biosynthesis
VNQRRRRVLQVVNNLNYGGMERLVAEIVRRADASRFEMHVLALGYIGHFGEGLDSVATLHLADRMSRWSILSPRTLARQLGRIAPDVVHMHSGIWYKAGTAAAMADVPYQIYTDHGRQNPDPWVNRAIDRRASRRTDVVVSVSEPLAVHMSTIVADPSRIRIIANGVDTERYTPRPDDGSLRSELGIANDVPIIGSIGRLEVVKGYDVLVRAFARLRGNFTDGTRPVLVLVGDGSQRSLLEQSASELGVADSIRFLGWRSDIENVLQAFTVFAMSSHSEGTSVSLLEAMSSGLCPIVTDVGGNAAVLGPALKHRLVQAADPEAMATALSAALRDATARARDSRAARERIVECFGLDQMVRRYEMLYSATPGEPPPQW